MLFPGLIGNCRLCWCPQPFDTRYAPANRSHRAHKQINFSCVKAILEVVFQIFEKKYCTFKNGRVLNKESASASALGSFSRSIAQIIGGQHCWAALWAYSWWLHAWDSGGSAATCPLLGPASSSPWPPYSLNWYAIGLQTPYEYKWFVFLTTTHKLSYPEHIINSHFSLFLRIL